VIATCLSQARSQTASDLAHAVSLLSPMYQQLCLLVHEDACVICDEHMMLRCLRQDAVRTTEDANAQGLCLVPVAMFSLLISNM
jgi:hypothetical protein